MFDIGWSELLVIGVVAIVVVGPKDLPKLLRGFGVYAGKLRRTAAEFQRQFEEAMREAELDEVKKALESVHEETRVLEPGTPLDRPVMVAKPAAAPPEAVAPAEPAPAAKSPRKRAAAKPKDNEKTEAKTGVKPAAKSGAKSGVKSGVRTASKRIKNDAEPAS